MNIAFEKFISSNNIIDVSLKNGLYTWSNRQSDNKCISQKLDHFLLSDNWNNV